MAISLPVSSVSVDPRKIADLRLATRLLGDLLHLNQQVLYSRLQWARQAHKGFMVVTHGVGALH